MGIRPDALYLDLLVDLSPWLRSDDWFSCFAGRPVHPSRATGARHASALALAGSFLKKLEDDPLPEAEEVALGKFVAANERCANWTDTSSLVEMGSEETWINQLFGQLRKELDDFYFAGESPLFDLTDAARLGGVGPGSNIGAHGADFYTKLFSSPLTCTSETLWRVYLRGIESYPDLLAAEHHRSMTFGNFSIVEGNRLSFVPKQRDCARVICTEPTLNMWVQKGLGELILRRMKRLFGVDLSRQPELNHELSRQGSIDGSFGTIDLASASDTISLGLLRSILPQHMLWHLEQARSPVTTLPSGEVVALQMVSSMGNGFTFPLQTLLFACAVRAVYKCLGIPLRDPNKAIRINLPGGVVGKSEHKSLGNWGVFGDDIIVCREAYDDVVRLLTRMGFEVNRTKSFNDGLFRESCGCDWFAGHNIRGVYIKTLEDVASRYSAINRLIRWSARHGLPLRRTISTLVKSVPANWVPLHEQDDCGIKVHSSHLRERKLSKNGSFLYKRWVPTTKRLVVGDNAIIVPRGEKGRIYNGYGLLVTALQGSIGTRTVHRGDRKSVV